MADMHAQAAEAVMDGGADVGQGVQMAGVQAEEAGGVQPRTPAIAPAPGFGGPGEGAAGPSGGIGPGGAASRAIAPDSMPGDSDLAQLMANIS